MNENVKAKWEAREKITGQGDSAKVIAQLVCNGHVYHELGGPCAYDSIKKYADRMNAEGKPEPDPKTRIGADGYSFKDPPKKAKDAPKTFIPSMEAWAKRHGLA